MSSKAGPKDGPVLLPVYAKPVGARNQTRFRYLACLALISVAVTLPTILPTPWSLVRNTVVRPLTVAQDPASQWKDDIWPIREQTPWDISTDYPYPRTLKYDVTEGTWLRLDVHPTSGDIIFDMVGDIYCLPAHEALRTHVEGERVKARPVLLGVPWDSDPHFSPEGDRFVFRSDAGLGVENIWVAEWKGCEAMDVRAVDSKNEGLRAALQVKEQEEDLLKEGVVETEGRKYRRLIREGRAGGKERSSLSTLWTEYHLSPPGDQRNLQMGLRRQIPSLGTQGYCY